MQGNVSVEFKTLVDALAIFFFPEQLQRAKNRKFLDHNPDKGQTNWYQNQTTESFPYWQNKKVTLNNLCAQL